MDGLHVKIRLWHHIKGEFNKVADCLSRYYESDMNADIHEFHEYVQADRKIDPSGEDLPNERRQEIKERVVEIRSMRVMELQHSQRLQEAQEHYDTEAAPMNQADKERAMEPNRADIDNGGTIV